MRDQIDITPDERAALYFLPTAVGGKVVPEEMQQRLQEKGLATPPREDGRRWLTELGDEFRRGRR
ncbi:MAG: hypothetical protein EOP37_03365 [Rubrivivax sp.]|nr:MAG: hypothetical protein EOP37_03365 [Rubrivivax sp.]